MGFFDKFKQKEKQVLEEKVDKKPEYKAKEYNPKLGDANRYENSRNSNRELAEKINEEASRIVKHAIPVLSELEQHPEQANFHSKISGSRWNSHFLDDKIKELQELYGCSQLEIMNRTHNSLPKEVIDFERRYNDFKYRNK